MASSPVPVLGRVRPDACLLKPGIATKYGLRAGEGSTPQNTVRPRRLEGRSSGRVPERRCQRRARGGTPPRSSLSARARSARRRQARPCRRTERGDRSVEWVPPPMRQSGCHSRISPRTSWTCRFASYLRTEAPARAARLRRHGPGTDVSGGGAAFCGGRCALPGGATGRLGGALTRRAGWLPGDRPLGRRRLR